MPQTAATGTSAPTAFSHATINSATDILLGRQAALTTLSIRSGTRSEAMLRTARPRMVGSLSLQSLSRVCSRSVLC